MDLIKTIEINEMENRKAKDKVAASKVDMIIKTSSQNDHRKNKERKNKSNSITKRSDVNTHPIYINNNHANTSYHLDEINTLIHSSNY